MEGGPDERTTPKHTGEHTTGTTSENSMKKSIDQLLSPSGDLGIGLV